MKLKNLKFAEIINGRAAMIGCSAIGLATIATKTSILGYAAIDGLQSIWWSLGVYSS
tara:strand:+ start:921 stop:1091 length:171 start_codon:yes stop_codon:yes gene_type:complete